MWARGRRRDDRAFEIVDTTACYVAGLREDGPSLALMTAELLLQQSVMIFYRERLHALSSVEAVAAVNAECERLVGAWVARMERAR